MDKITNNFFHSQTNSTTELGHSPPFLDFSRKLLVNGFIIMINYIYIQLYNLQGWFVRVSGSPSTIKSLFFLLLNNIIFKRSSNIKQDNVWDHNSRRLR